MEQNILSKIWQKFKKEPDRWLFFCFLLSFPLSIRKIFIFFPIKGYFNEYTSISFFLSDILLFLTIVLWLFTILWNKYGFLSILKTLFLKLSTGQDCFFKRNLWIKCLKSLKCSTPARQCQSLAGGWNIFKDKLIFIPLLLVVWSFLSIIWSNNHPIALFRSTKLLEFFFLYTYIRFRLFHACPPVPVFGRRVEQFKRNKSQAEFISASNSNKKILKQVQNDNNLSAHKSYPKECSTWNIGKLFSFILIFSSLIQSIIGIWQFFVQRSIGLSWLKESLISPEIPGVAKVIIGNERYIRAYGLFPHPNILGGFLLFSIILSYAYRKDILNFFDKCSTPARQCQSLAGGWNISDKFQVFSKNVWRRFKLNSISNKLDGARSMFHVEQLSWNVVIAIQILALFLTFSKSALIGLLIASLYLFINSEKNGRAELVSVSAPQEKILNQVQDDKSDKQLFHVEQLKKLRNYFLISLGIFAVILFYFKIDPYSLFIKSLEERLIYLNASIRSISEHLLFGLGEGQFVSEMGAYASKNLEFWQFQPVHNVFLLILSELGMIGLFFFIWFLLELFHPEKIVPRGTILDALGWNIYLKAILLGFIFIMLFDHYLWDIQQGGLLLWMVFGLL